MSFDPTDPIGSVFAPVLGRPCWNVRPGYGSAFMLEFGEPHLEIREPIVSTSESEKVRRLLARRQVAIVGQWSLLVEFCRWAVRQDNQPVATSETEPANVAAVVDTLAGQRLVNVHADGATGRCRFDFDLGAALETSRSGDEEPGEWTVFTPEAMALGVRADGTYVWRSSGSRDRDTRWTPLPAAR